MSDDFFANWPKDILKEYGKLKLPSLWEYIKTQEKQALHISEINKKLDPLAIAIKKIDEKMKIFDEEIDITLLDFEQNEKEYTQNSDDQVQSNLLSTSLKNYPAWEVDMMKQANQLEQRQWEEAYLAMYETLNQLIQDQKRLYQEIISFFSINTRTRVKEKQVLKIFILDKVKKTESYQRQLQSHLHDQGIEVICPESGDGYDEKLHRVIMPHSSVVNKMKTQNVHKARISELIHCGYLRSSTIIRRADVTLLLF